jgi:hypothetical protein
MKKLLLVVMMLVSVSAFAQFKLKTGVGMGVQIYTNEAPNIYQTNLTVTPQQTIDKLTLGLVTQTFIQNNNTDAFIGANASYPMWTDSDGLRTLFLSAHYLHGSEGRQLIGGGVGYGNADVELDLDVSQEYKSKTMFIGVTLSTFLIK